MKQAHAAYEQVNDFVTKAMGAWTGTMPAGFKDVQARLMAFTKENGELAFTFTDKVSDASTFQEFLTLQTQFAQDWMLSFVKQTQELYKLFGEMTQKPGRG